MKKISEFKFSSGLFIKVLATGSCGKFQRDKEKQLRKEKSINSHALGINKTEVSPLLYLITETHEF